MVLREGIRRSTRSDSHPVTHVAHLYRCARASPLRAFGENGSCDIGVLVQVGEPRLNRRKRRNDNFGQITLEGAIPFSNVTVLDDRYWFSVEKAVHSQQVR